MLQMEAEGLISSEHSLIPSISVVMWATLHTVALWPRLFEPFVSVDRLTGCYHNCILGVRMFGLTTPNPGSATAIRNNEVETQRKTSNNFRALCLANKNVFE